MAFRNAVQIQDDGKILFQVSTLIELKMYVAGNPFGFFLISIPFSTFHFPYADTMFLVIKIYGFGGIGRTARCVFICAKIFLTLISYIVVHKTNFTTYFTRFLEPYPYTGDF